eukprot:1724941-Rhodomonas_salina.1
MVCEVRGERVGDALAKRRSELEGDRDVCVLRVACSAVLCCECVPVKRGRERVQAEEGDRSSKRRPCTGFPGLHCLIAGPAWHHHDMLAPDIASHSQRQLTLPSSFSSPRTRASTSSR